MQRVQTPEDASFDAVLKDMFVFDHPSVLDSFTAGRKVVKVLSGEFPKVLERRSDLLLLLSDGSLLHIEFQAGNDMDMAYRQGIYSTAFSPDGSIGRR